MSKSSTSKPSSPENKNNEEVKSGKSEDPCVTPTSRSSRFKFLPQLSNFTLRPVKKLFIKVFSANDDDDIPTEVAGTVGLPRSGIDIGSRFAKGDISIIDSSSLIGINTTHQLNTRIQKYNDTFSDGMLLTTPEKMFTAGTFPTTNPDHVTSPTQYVEQQITDNTEPVKPFISLAFRGSKYLVQMDPHTQLLKSPTQIEIISSTPDKTVSKSSSLLPRSSTISSKKKKDSMASAATPRNAFNLANLGEALAAEALQKSFCRQLFLATLRVILFAVFILGSSLLLALFGAVTSYSFNSSIYQLYGTAVIDGFLLSIYIVTIMRKFTSSSRTKDHLMLYTKLYLYHRWIFVQTVAVMVGLTIAFESKVAKNIYWFVLYKGIAVFLAMIVYFAYFLRKHKQVKTVDDKKSKGKKKHFFYTDIYKQFLEELRQAEHKLKAPSALQIETEKKASFENKTKRRQSIFEAFAKRNSQWLDHSLHRTPVTQLIIIGPKQIVGITIIIFFPFLQLMVAFSLNQLFIFLLNNYNTYAFLAAIAIYPAAMDIFRAISGWIDSSFKMDLNSNAIFLSTAFGTLPFRIFFLSVVSLDQALCMIATRIGYKFLVYIIYGILWKWVKKIANKVALYISKKRRKAIKKIDLKFGKPSAEKRIQRKMSLIISESQNADKSDESEKPENIEVLAITFEIIQICDFCNIFVFWIILLCFYPLRDQISGSLGLIKSETYQTLRVSSPIELGCELVFWFVVTWTWKLAGSFKKVSLRKKIKEISLKIKKLYFAVSAILFFTFYLALERYGYETLT